MSLVYFLCSPSLCSSIYIVMTVLWIPHLHFASKYIFLTLEPLLHIWSSPYSAGVCYDIDSVQIINFVMYKYMYEQSEPDSPFPHLIIEPAGMSLASFARICSIACVHRYELYL